MNIAQKHSKLPPTPRLRRAGKGRRKILVFVLLSAFSLQLSAFLISCAHLEKYSPGKGRFSAVSIGDLKGLSKVDIVKKFGQPLATSKSDVSEAWYYAQPSELWIWFDKNKVERWEVK